MTLECSFQVGPLRVGEGVPPRVIAEIGVNHNGSEPLARRMVRAAARAGADFAKFQTFRAEALVASGAPKAMYQARRGTPGADQREMLRRYELPPAAFLRLKGACKAARVGFLATPFEEPSLRFLVAEAKVPAIKVSSDNLTNLPFLRAVAKAGLPVFLSTGMGNLQDVQEAVRAVRSAGNRRLVLFQCTSNYPARIEDANLRVLETYRREFGCLVGLSDHTPGTFAASLAVALGACVIEKHFTTDRTLPGPDQTASLDPTEMAALVRDVRKAWEAMGDGRKRLQPSERAIRRVAGRSLVYAHDMKAGSPLRGSDLLAKRPGTGVPPSRKDALVGRRLLRSVRSDALLREGDLAQ
ncbi:MAG: N-acetylneuraminate synthase family protein [Planctomycetes bacterium]|nr:N-acetylneuraminate synthase family protein [Planctomycetota bacterium]